MMPVSSGMRFDAENSRCIPAEQMTPEELRQLHRLTIVYRPRACSGCGLDHDCSVHGCAVSCWEVRQMSVFEFNCLYAAKALFMVFVVAPMLFMLGVSLVYAVSQFLGSIWNAIILHRFPILRCKKCRYWATVQCPLYGRNTPSDFCSRGERWGD